MLSFHFTERQTTATYTVKFAKMESLGTMEKFHFRNVSTLAGIIAWYSFSQDREFFFHLRQHSSTDRFYCINYFSQISAE